MLRLYNGWRKLISVAARPTPLTPISIVITFRDEAEKLPALVNSLIPQLNLSAHSEIILVDDHSTDDCIRQLKDLTADQDRIHILQPADLHGKKACQYLGISSAKNNWIVTLDADVSIDQNWLMRLSYHAANSQASVLILPLMISDGKNLFGGLQSLEFFSLIFTTAASASNKNALL